MSGCGDNSNNRDGDETPPPQLMYFERGSGLLKFYDPSLDSIYSMSTKDIWGDDVIFGIHYYHSNCGWILLGLNKDVSYSLFLFNPSTKTAIPLPNPPDHEPDPRLSAMWQGFELMSFSSSPPDCTIVGISLSGQGCIECIRLLKPGDTCWTLIPDIEYNQNFVMSHCPSLVYNGATDAFYVLGRHGILGKLSVRSEDNTCHLEVIVTPRQEERFKNLEDLYLVESDGGDLMCVGTLFDGAQVFVLKLNRHRMVWENVDDLDGQVLYLSNRTSIARRTTLQGTS